MWMTSLGISRRQSSRKLLRSFAIQTSYTLSKLLLTIQCSRLSDKYIFFSCCTKVIMSGVNGNVIMSGCRDDNPDDERREAARDNTKSVSRGADGGGGWDGDRSQ